MPKADRHPHWHDLVLNQASDLALPSRPDGPASARYADRSARGAADFATASPCRCKSQTQIIDAPAVETRLDLLAQCQCHALRFRPGRAAPFPGLSVACFMARAGWRRTCIVFDEREGMLAVLSSRKPNWRRSRANCDSRPLISDSNSAVRSRSVLIQGSCSRNASIRGPRRSSVSFDFNPWASRRSFDQRLFQCLDQFPSTGPGAIRSPRGDGWLPSGIESVGPIAANCRSAERRSFQRTRTDSAISATRNSWRSLCVSSSSRSNLPFRTRPFGGQPSVVACDAADLFQVGANPIALLQQPADLTRDGRLHRAPGCERRPACARPRPARWPPDPVLRS